MKKTLLGLFWLSSILLLAEEQGKCVGLGDLLLSVEYGLSLYLFENDALQIEQNQYAAVTYSDGTQERDSAKHIFHQFGGTLEYLLLDRLGITGGYFYKILYQSISLGSGEYERYTYAGIYAGVHNPQLGLSYHLPTTAHFLDSYLFFRGGLEWGSIQPQVATADLNNVPPQSHPIFGFNASMGLGLNIIMEQRYNLGLGVDYNLDYLSTPPDLYGTGNSLLFHYPRLFLLLGILINGTRSTASGY